MTNSYPVIQADREAAANYMAQVSALRGEYDPVAMAFMDPACDAMPIVQSFAKHRCEALEQAAREVLQLQRNAFAAGFEAAERALGFEGSDESDEALKIEWNEYRKTLATATEEATRSAVGKKDSAREIRRLRTAIIKMGRLIPGCGLADSVSTDFLMLLPEEMRAWKATLPHSVATPAKLGEDDVERVARAWSSVMRRFAHVFGSIDAGYTPEIEEMRAAIAALPAPDVVGELERERTIAVINYEMEDGVLRLWSELVETLGAEREPVLRSMLDAGLIVSDFPQAKVGDSGRQFWRLVRAATPSPGGVK